jgi:NTE family protein
MGLAHIGVLKVLEREKIPIDVIAGSSIGALIGCFWAAGLDSNALREIAYEFRTKRSLLKLADPMLFPKFGIFQGKQVERILKRQLGKDRTFRELHLPVKVTACDYRRRELVLLDEGSVIQAIRASVSIPGIFVPQRVRGRYLIDGGILAPVPVEVLSQMGVRKIIAVNTLPNPAEIRQRQQEVAEERARLRQEAKMGGWGKALAYWMKELWWNWLDTNVFDVLMHSMQGMEYVLAEAACAQADVVLHPTIPRVNWWEFYSVDELLRRGEEEAEAHLDEIRRLVSE